MNKKIKLYIFSPYSFIGGDTLSISRLIANLDTKNYDISFICLKKTKILNYLKKKKFKIIRTNTTRTIFSIFDIIKIIKKDLKKKYKKYIFLSNQNFANIVVAPAIDKPWFFIRKFNKTLGHPSLVRTIFSISRSMPSDTIDVRPNTRGNLILGAMLNIAAPMPPRSDPKTVMVTMT